jgi:hypothetical protein
MALNARWFTPVHARAFHIIYLTITELITCEYHHQSTGAILRLCHSVAMAVLATKRAAKLPWRPTRGHDAARDRGHETPPSFQTDYLASLPRRQ